MDSTALYARDWEVLPASNEIKRGQTVIALEPKLMEILLLFLSSNGQVLAKDDIIQNIWDDVFVTDDALSRAIFKLRKALGDDAKSPEFIETIPKRGYRWIAPVKHAEKVTQNQFRISLMALSAVIVFGLGCFTLWSALSRKPDFRPNVAASQLERADNFYSQYTQKDNKTALRLYQGVVDKYPENSKALSGLSLAITQKYLRYDTTENSVGIRTSLTQALQEGALNNPRARSGLSRSEGFAQLATQIDPDHGRAWRALGLARSGLGDLEGAEAAYLKAIEIDSGDWGSMINLSELYNLKNMPEKSRPYLERAWQAMEDQYGPSSVAIHPWQASVGNSVAQAYLAEGQDEEAELWFRRVIVIDPLNETAILALVDILRRFGEDQQADELCSDIGLEKQERCFSRVE